MALSNTNKERIGRMKIFLTGATGLLGNNILRVLLDQGHSVRCLVRTPADLPPEGLKDLDAELVQGSLTECEDFSPLTEGCEAIVHCAASVHIGWKKYDQSRLVNVVPTGRIADAAMGHKIRLVHVSTVDTLAYSYDGRPMTELDRQPAKPQNNYVRSKTEAEQEVFWRVDKGLDGLVIHPGFLIGPNDWKPSSGKMLLSIAKKEIPLAPKGGCSAVDVRSVAQGVVNSITKGKAGENYILGGENLPYKELFEKLATAIGVKPPKLILTPPAAWVGKLAANVVNKFISGEGDFNSAMIEMGQLNHFYSSQKAIDQLDYQIDDLTTAIADAWEFLKIHHPLRK